MAVVRYLVADTDEAVGFYTELLGFTLQTRMGPAFAIRWKLVGEATDVP